MQDHVDAGDGVGGPVHLLAAIAHLVGPVAVLDLEIGRVDEHPAAATGRVIHGLAGLRRQDADEDIHDLRRREELARLGARVVGELLDQVFVSAADHIGLDIGVGEVDVGAVEVLDQGADHRIRDQLPLSVGGGLVPVYGEDAGQLEVGRRDVAHGLGQQFADVFADRQHVAPVAAVGDLEAVDVAAGAQRNAFRISERPAALLLELPDLLVGLVVPLVGEPLEEHQREDVGLVVLAGGSAPENVGRAPQVRFQLLLRHLWHRCLPLFDGLMGRGIRRLYTTTCPSGQHDRKRRMSSPLGEVEKVRAGVGWGGVGSQQSEVMSRLWHDTSSVCAFPLLLCPP